jgi:hypothetical protein
MPRRWRQARWWRLLGGQRVSAAPAAMSRPDRRRRIDAVIDDDFGEAGKPVQPARAREAPGPTRGCSSGTRSLVGARTSKVFTTDGPFAETKEQLGAV